MIQRRLREKGSRKAFTIPEIMLSMTIMCFVFAGLYSFLTDTTLLHFVSSEKLEINRDIRMFTQHMSEYARASNHFFIYKSFNTSDRNEPSDRVRDGNTGDFLLLVYQRPHPTLKDPEHIVRLVGYFRKADSNGEGPVYRFEINYPPSQYKSTADYTPEALIAGLSPNGNYEEVIELSRGMANGQLFYNFFDRSIMVKAEIIHGHSAKRVTDTYNFTVSPRG